MYVTVKDLEIYFQKVGKGKNLLMLHGWGNDVSTFWGIVDYLRKDYTIYLIDLPGFGRSSYPKIAYTILDYADVVKDFILKNKLGKSMVLGHSLGGRIGIKLAANNPKLVKKLILEDAAGIRPRRDLLKRIFYFPSKAFRYLVPNVFNLKNIMRYKFYSLLESDYLKAGALKSTLENILAEDLTDDLRKINAETLILWGEKDPTSEASLSNGKRMYKLIKNARMEIFEGVGHFPHIEKPERFSYYVKDFS